MKRMPWGRIKTALKLSDVNIFDPGRKRSLKNGIENANTFYKMLVGMDKVENQRSNMISLQGLLIKSKENLDLEEYRLKLTRHQMKRLDGEVSQTDRLRHYERFAELLHKEKSLKCEEEDLMAKVKQKENDRDAIQTKLDTTKTTILMLEKDHTYYHKWLKYLFSFITLFGTLCYMSDIKKILEGIAEIKKMNKSGDGVAFKQIFQLIFSTAYGGVPNVYNGLWWGCEKGYQGLKCGARVTWNASKSAAGIAGSGIKVGAEKTVDATKWGYSYASWTACGGYNQVKKLIYPEKND